jgi:hypothetical protein
MRVVESIVRSTVGPPALSEDAVVVSEHHVAVLDGATFRGEPPGPTAGEVTRALAAEIDAFPPDIDLPDATIQMTRALADLYDGLPAEPASRSAAVFVAVSDSRREVWRIGDCQFMLGSRLHARPTRVEQHAAACRAAMLELALIRGATLTGLRGRDVGRELILPLIQQSAYFRNGNATSDWSFGALDGAPIPEGFLEIYPVPEGPIEVVLASDGYPQLKATLPESEDTLRDLISEDPLMFRRHMALKGVYADQESFDDRAYVRIRM